MDIQYPNREHRNADRSARRRLYTALGDLVTHAEQLRTLVSDPAWESSASDADRFANSVQQVTKQLAVLETLRDVREWHAADEAERHQATPPLPPGGPRALAQQGTYGQLRELLAYRGVEGWDLSTKLEDLQALVAESDRLIAGQEASDG